MSGLRRSIMVLGKEPIPGRVKTRLTPPLNAVQSARLAGAMLQDTLTLAQCVDRAQVTLAHPPLEDEALLAELVPTGVSRLISHGCDVGASMLEAGDAALADGADSVVIIGADLPNLPVHLIEDAFVILEREQRAVVLGPSFDGGYYLIGLGQRQPRLFSDIEWSTDQVMRQTLEQARTVGLRVHLLPPWQDVDLPTDLDWLARSLADAPRRCAPATRAVLATCWPTGCTPHREAY